MLIRFTIMAKGLLLVAVPLLFQLVLISVITEKGRQEHDADLSVAHSRVVLQQAERLLTRLGDAQMGIRGYVLTGNPVFAEPYDRSEQELPQQFDALKALLSDIPKQQAVLESIAINTADWLVFHKENMRLVRAGARDEAVARIAGLTGKQQMDDIQREIEAFQTEMERLADERSQLRELNHTSFKWVIVVGTGVSMLLAVLLAVVFTRGISRRLAVLLANIQRLVQGRELTPPVGGSDEIATVDQAFREMAQTLAQSRDELAKHNHVLQSMLDNMGDGVTVVDETGKFLVFNPAAKRIIGMGPTDGTPREWSEGYGTYLPDQTTLCPSEQLPLARAMRGEEVDMEELFVRNPEKSAGTWITVTARPLKDDRGVACGGVAVFQDVTQRKHAEKAMLDLQAALDEHAIVAVTDARGKITFVNDKFCEISQYSREELLGQDHRIINSGHHPQAFIRDLWETITSGRVWKGEFKNRAKDDTFYWVDTTIVPFLDTHGEPFQYIAIRTDISERIRVEEQFIQARDDAESANRAKSDFLASMSHELRTPLNGILGMNELMMNTELTERQRQFVEACSTSGKALLHQINDILDLSKIEAGKLELDLHECHLDALVYDIVDVSSHSARQKGYPLHCHIAPSACMTVVCDGNRLRQILINLVGNALKFTISGSVTVRVECLQHLDRQLTVRFSVTDTGVGIPEDRRDRLFAPFSQVDSSTSRKFGGTGLGLSICKQLVELMGGQIGVESQLGVGSTFWFEVPLQFAAADATIAQRRNLLAGKRVLAVDGIDRERKQIGDSLQAWECPFEQVATLQQALEAVARAEAAGAPFAVMLADCRLVVGDEFVLLQKLATQSRLPIIGLGTNPDDETIAYLHQLGVRHVLRDPVRPSALFNALASVLSVDAAHLPHDDGQGETRQEQPSRLSGHVLVAEDNRINQMFIVELLKHCGCTCDVTANGDEVLEARQHQRYDLVLMDCQMPEMDGFTATREIRRREAAGELPSRLPIIALTANALKGDRERCLEAGMDDYLSKPIDSKQLQAMLEKFLLPQSD